MFHPSCYIPPPSIHPILLHALHAPPHHPRGQTLETHTHRTLFVASGRCGSTRWSADDPFGSGIRRFGRARHPKLDGGRGSSCQREDAENENESLAATRSVPVAGSGNSSRGFSGLTRRLARQEARNAECGPSSFAAARLWMPDVEKLGRSRPGSTDERRDD